MLCENCTSTSGLWRGFASVTTPDYGYKELIETE